MTSPPSTSANPQKPGSLLHDGESLLLCAEAGGWLESPGLTRPTHWGPTVLSPRTSTSTNRALTSGFYEFLTWDDAA